MIKKKIAILGSPGSIGKTLLKIIENLTIIIHPFIPHLSEEIWQSMGKKELCISDKWPKTKNVVEESIIKMPVQINGKTRDILEVEKDLSEQSILKIVLKSTKIKKYTENKEIFRTIFVKNKIVNYIIK